MQNINEILFGSVSIRDGYTIFAPMSRLLKLGFCPFDMLVQMGSCQPISIFFLIGDPLPHELLQPVPHGGHDVAHT